LIPHVVSTAVEHPAILEYLRAKEAEKVLTYELVPVNDEGLVDPQDVAAAVTERTCLVSVMHANNETGAIQPVAKCAQLCKARNPKVLVHTDAAQSCGKIPVKVNELCVDMCTIVGHKIGAPKGVAALYVQKGAPFSKLLHGGGQEGGRRAGTENVLHVVGLGAACELVERESTVLPRHLAAMRDELARRIEVGLGGIDGSGVRVNGPADDSKRLPNTLSVGVKGVSASQLLDVLKDDVAASAGAACHTGDAAASVSAVLQAMNVPEEYAIGTLRLSVGRHTGPADVERGAACVVNAAIVQREEIAALPEGERPWWCVRKAVGLVD
jgi:cysteine desulfurase